jgi:hypothetical protein
MGWLLFEVSHGFIERLNHLMSFVMTLCIDGPIVSEILYPSVLVMVTSIHAAQWSGLPLTASENAQYPLPCMLMPLVVKIPLMGVDASM